MIGGTRMERIARGAGVSISDIRELVKQFRQSKKLVKMMKGGSPEKMMKKIQGMGNVRFK